MKNMKEDCVCFFLPLWHPSSSASQRTMLIDEDHPDIVTVPSRHPTTPTTRDTTTTTTADSLLGSRRGATASAVVLDDDPNNKATTPEVRPPVTTPQRQQQSDHVSVGDELDMSLCTPGNNKLTTSAMVKEIEEYLEIVHQPIPQQVNPVSSPARTKTLRERVKYIEEVSGEESEGSNWKEKVRNLHYKLFN